MTGETEPLGELARLLGALQEARRLDCAVVGTEHLLIATLAEPGVRRALLTVGCQLSDVQAAIATISSTRERGFGDERVELTAEAAVLLTRIAAKTPELESTGSTDVQTVSLALRTTMVELLTHDWDSAARRAIAKLSLLGHARALTALIESSAEQPEIPPR